MFNLNRGNIQVERLLDSVDAVIYVLDYTKLKTADEAEVLRRLKEINPQLMDRLAQRLFFVVNKADMIETSEGMDAAATKQYVADLITQQIHIEGFQLKEEQVGCSTCTCFSCCLHLHMLLTPCNPLTCSCSLTVQPKKGTAKILLDSMSTICDLCKCCSDSSLCLTEICHVFVNASLQRCCIASDDTSLHFDAGVAALSTAGVVVPLGARG